MPPTGAGPSRSVNAADEDRPPVESEPASDEAASREVAISPAPAVSKENVGGSVSGQGLALIKWQPVRPTCHRAIAVAV